MRFQALIGTVETRGEASNFVDDILFQALIGTVETCSAAPARYVPVVRFKPS